MALEHVVTGVTLDLAVGVSGFEQQIVRRAKPVEIAGQTINIATAEDLIVMKTLAGRPQDEQDIAGIIQRQRELWIDGNRFATLNHLRGNRPVRNNA